VEMLFESTITPNPGAVFSQLTFTDGIDNLYRPLKPGTVFQNPITHMYAVFSYDSMIVGSQWTALWYREGELVHYETIPWNGGSGGLGYTDWAPDPSEWLPGLYEVQIFVGNQFKQSGFFTVEGEPPTPVPTQTPTNTSTPTRTFTPTRTPRPTLTPTPTRTPRPSPQPYYSPTPTIKPTPYPTLTRTPTPTITQTRTPTPTHTPTLTRTPTAPPTTPPAPD
jgi:type VI secretion system secreted protein VgrG